MVRMFASVVLTMKRIATILLCCLCTLCAQPILYAGQQHHDGTHLQTLHCQHSLQALEGVSIEVTGIQNVPVSDRVTDVGGLGLETALHLLGIDPQSRSTIQSGAPPIFLLCHAIRV